MMFEYKVVPAPTRGLKAKGVKGSQARFANALQSLMNELGADGWEYQRTDTLPLEERQGLTGKMTSYQNMLVFRRTLAVEAEEQPEVAALIEDQTESVQTESVQDDTVEEGVTVDQPAPLAAEALDEAEEVEIDAKARVEETLKADTFAFPWDRRTKSTKADTDANDETAESSANL